MASKNGSKELISLLQYMKDTRLDNPEIKVNDEQTPAAGAAEQVVSGHYNASHYITTFRIGM